MKRDDKVYTSPSRLDAFFRCKRNWWMTYCMKLPRPRGKADTRPFGRVMHKAIENFLTGQPLFGEGWDIDKDTGTRLEPADAALVQVLVNKGIEEGILERRPTSKVELQGELSIGTVGEARFIIDHTDMESRIEDHKHSKSASYFKSANKLKEDVQLNFYAKWLIEQLKKQGKVPPKIITLVHNQFLKDHEKPAVRRREAEVSPVDVEKFFEEKIIPACSEMRKLKTGVTNPFDIEDPLPSSCYGCDRIPICTRQETMAQYRRRVESINSRIDNPTPDPEKTSMTTPNDFMEKMRQKRAAASSGEAPVNPPAAAAPAAVTAPTAAKPDGYKVPPWADPKCGLCSSSAMPGFNIRKGSPCRICLSQTNYDMGSIEWDCVNGNVRWWKKGEAAPVAETAAPVAESKGTKTAAYTANDFLAAINSAELGEIGEILKAAGEVVSDHELGMLADVAEERIAVLNTQQTPPPKAEPEPAPQAKPEPQPEASAPAEEKPKRKRRTKAEMAAAAAEGIQHLDSIGGLILAIGCAPIRSDLQVVLAEEILSSVEGYWEADDVFKRRAAVRTAAEQTAKSLGSCIVVQQGRDPDVDNLISSLVPHATAVFRGTIQ